MIEALVLDWSGTMADDLPITLDATNATLVAFGGDPVSPETYRREFRIPVMGFYEKRVRGDATLEEIDRVFFEQYRRRLVDIPLYAGVEEVLRAVKSRGQRLFLLSTVPSSILEDVLVLKGLDGLVDGIYGGATDKREVLPRLLEEQGLDHDRVLFVGDTLHDLETARRSRVRGGASLYGYGLRESLLAAEHDYAFEKAGDIGRLLDREHLLDSVPLVIPTVGGLLVGPDGRVLLVRTTKWSNSWGIPGGKIDYGETMEDAYVREIAEETGLRAENNRLLMIQDCIEAPEFVKKRHFLLINYLSDVADPTTLRENYELEEARWVTPAEALGMNVNAPTRALFDEVRRRGLLGFDAEADGR